MGLIIFASSRGHSQLYPIGCFIARAFIPFGIDKGLKKIQPMMVNTLPLGGKNLGHFPKNKGAEARDRNPGQNKKAGVIVLQKSFVQKLISQGSI